MTTTISSFRQITANLPAALDRTASEPQVRRESANYLATISKVKSIDDLMGNDRAYRFVLKSYGLDEMAYAKAFIRRILTEGIDRRDSLANRLADPRYRDLVTDFNFARYGSTTTTFGRTQQGTVDRYVRQTLESDVGRSNNGLQLALYFERKASSVTTPYALMADRALLKVTQVALGLAEATGRLDIDRQAELIKNRMEIADLKDPVKLDRFLTRFTALWDSTNPSATQSTAPNLFSGNATASFGIDLLEQVQRVRRKG
ncbi:MAG: DUF1217 domain-containing protein [Hyphomicrobium aestuarii]|nr:DUF1217 domain-containing protein [Hyphomicrobium aestuarii]